MKIRKPGGAVALMAAMIVASAGGAYAYWAVNGAGTGTATVGQIKTLEIDQADIHGLMLDKQVPLNVSVKNLNDFEVSLKGLKGFTVTGDVDRSHQGCTFATNFKIVPPVFNSHISIIGGHESASFEGGSITLANDPNLNQVACQGAVVTLTYVLK
jgi:hypothetical protein